MLAVIYTIATLIPNLSLTVRRLHDSGKSSAWLVLFFSPVVMGLIFILILIMSTVGVLINLDDATFMGMASGFVVLAAVFGLYQLACFIIFVIWFIFMLLPTSIKCIGVSTHEPST